MLWRSLDYTDWGHFQRVSNAAAKDVVIADAVRSADHFFHTLFVSGEEPKWAHPSQREAAIEHTTAILRLAKAVGVVS